MYYNSQSYHKEKRVRNIQPSNQQRWKWNNKDRRYKRGKSSNILILFKMGEGGMIYPLTSEFLIYAW